MLSAISRNQIIFIVFTVLVVVSLPFIPRLFSVLTSNSPPGQWAYLLSKWLGLSALTLLLIQKTAVLLTSFKIGGVRAVAGRLLHRVIGTAIVVAVFAHVAFFISASSIRKALIDWHLLLPVFGGSYYALMVSLGAIAFYLLLGMLITGWLMHYRVRLQSSRATVKFLLVHRISSVALVGLAVFHSFSIGSETRDINTLLMLLVLVTLVVALLLYLAVSGVRAKLK